MGKPRRDRERILVEDYIKTGERIDRAATVLKDLKAKKEKIGYQLRDYLEERNKETTAKYKDYGEFSFHHTTFFNGKKEAMSDLKAWLERIDRLDAYFKMDTVKEDISDADLREIIKTQKETGGELPPKSLGTYDKLVITNRRK